MTMGYTRRNPIRPDPALASYRVETPRRGPLRRMLRWSGFACILAIALIFGGFLRFADSITTMKPPADPKADAIVVLTGGYQRIDQAVELLQKGAGKRLLISGVHPSTTPAQIRKTTTGSADLFDCCVDIGYDAIDTIGNAEESAKWVRGHAYGRVILVTNNYHMPRSLLEMGRLLDREELEPYPVVNSNLDNGGWMVQPDALRVLFTEYGKYLWALTRGLVPLPRPTDDGVTMVDVSAGGD